MESRYIHIHFDALAHNFNVVKQRVGNSLIMPIVKANAYGHGLVESALFLQSCGANYLGVALIEEAIQLRRAGITIPILGLGSMTVEQIPIFLKYNIDIMAASIDKLRLINECAQVYKTNARVHLKIDTGLGRIGMRATNAEQLFRAALSHKHITIVGVASHFATADDQNLQFTQEQCERFYQATLFFEKHSLPMPIRHIANSGGILQHPQSHFDMVRPGIMLYGVYPQSWMKSLCALKPVMSLYARVVYFKVLLQGNGISYGLNWKTPKDTRIITLPLGYGDGYPRALSNKGHVLVNGTKCPIVGNICMDQMMVDIGSGQAFNGDEVVLIGKSGDQEITINDLVDSYQASPYEILVLLNSRITRHYLYPELQKN